jgi:hypothetical protein
VRRLKRVAQKAERQEVLLGIESWLSAADHVRLIDAVGSPNVQVYYTLRMQRSEATTSSQSFGSSGQFG